MSRHFISTQCGDLQQVIDAFISNKLKYYRDLRNDPGKDHGSHMNAAGLRRTFDIEAYVQRVNALKDDHVDP